MLYYQISHKSIVAVFTYKVSQNSTDKIGGVAEWTQTNIFRFGTYCLYGVFTELWCFLECSNLLIGHYQRTFNIIFLHKRHSKLLHGEMKLKYWQNNNLKIIDILFWPCCENMNATEYSSQSSSSSLVFFFTRNESFTSSIVFISVNSK